MSDDSDAAIAIAIYIL